MQPVWRYLWVAIAATLAMAATTPAQIITTPIDRVEEDWVLVVNTPDTVDEGPQITTCMSPVGDNSTPFVAFDINYREYPTFQSGGMQLQVWSNDANNQVLSTSTQGTSLLATPGETISWTQQMSLSNGAIAYDISNGQSQTWGKFGQGNNLGVQFTTSLASLGGYSPNVSKAKSGVTWEANHVTSLTIVQVRYYSGGQLVSTDTNPRSVTLGN